MEILKHGSTPFVIWTFACEVCGCIFEADKNDRVMGLPSGGVMLYCPWCGKLTGTKESRCINHDED